MKTELAADIIGSTAVEVEAAEEAEEETAE